MNIILFDDQERTSLLPLCFTRPCGDLRVGILTLKEKWQKLSGGAVSFLTQDYLQDKFPIVLNREKNYYINGRILPTQALLNEISSLDNGESLISNDGFLLGFKSNSSKTIENLDKIERSKVSKHSFDTISNCYNIFSLNDQEIRSDFELLTKNRTSAKLSNSNTAIGSNLFIEEGATVEGTILNSSTGPIYIGKGAEIMEGAVIRGPFALCENATIKMGAKIYGATTVGPQCKVGGEISNVMFYGHSNKGHDGFVGNSVIGEWCNIGADTNCSNLKNNYAPVKLWNYSTKRFSPTGLQFCGMIMGDHSKCGINTMFNTGTVVGVSTNIFGSGFPRNFVPSFTWGGSSGFSTYSQGKAFDTASKVMERRKLELTDQEINILKNIFETSSEFRIWENKPLKT